MNTQPLVFIPAWLARINAVQKLIPQDSMFGEFDYKRACHWQIARVRMFVIRQVRNNAPIPFAPSTPAACAPTLSAQPVATPLAQAGTYFVPGVGLVDDFDGTPLNADYDHLPSKGQNAALLNQLFYRLAWIAFPLVAFMLFFRSLAI